MVAALRGEVADATSAADRADRIAVPNHMAIIAAVSVLARAGGEASRVSAPAVWNSLSAQELQVARMVAEGLSNRQIGERLYLSHRTVASHLYRIFPKLGIISRAQLTAMSLDLPESAG